MNLTDFWKQYKQGSVTQNNLSVTDFWGKYKQAQAEQAAEQQRVQSEQAANAEYQAYNQYQQQAINQSAGGGYGPQDVYTTSTGVSPYGSEDVSTGRKNPGLEYLMAAANNDLYEWTDQNGQTSFGVGSQYGITPMQRLDNSGAPIQNEVVYSVGGESGIYNIKPVSLDDAKKYFDETNRTKLDFGSGGSRIPYLASQLSADQAVSAIKHIQSTPEADFIDLSGNVVSPGTKYWSPDKGGYWEYAPSVKDLKYAKSNPEGGVGGGPELYNTAFSGMADLDTWDAGSQYRPAYADYSSWKWTPAKDNAQPADLLGTLYSAGVVPQQQFGGTMGQGGWNAVKGVGSAAAGVVAQIAAPAIGATGASANGVTNAVGQGTNQAATIGNVISKGVQNLTGLSNNVSQAIGSGISTLGGAALTGGGLENAGIAGLTGGFTQGLTPAVQDYLRAAGISEGLSKGLSSGFVSSGIGSAAAAAAGGDPMYAAARGLGAFTGGLTSGYTGQNWLGNLTSTVTNRGLSQLYRR